MSTLTITVASGADLVVRRFTVHEAISTPFTVSVFARSRDPGLDLSAVTGQPGTFAVDIGPGGARTWNGIVSFAQQSQAEPTGFSTYFFRIVPSLWLLTERRNHRIFQHLSIPQIVDRLLSEWGLDRTWRIDESLYPPLEIKVQWGESDYTFLARMLEEAGISFLFTNDGATVLFTDAPEKGDLRPGSPVTYVEGSVRSSHYAEYVTHVELGHEVRPGAFTIRDYDFRRPAYPLFGKGEPAPAPESFYEQYHYLPGGMARDVDLGEAGPSPVGDDRGWVRHVEEYGKARAQRALEGERAGRRSALFQANFVSIAGGDLMTLAGHPNPEIGPGERLLVVDLEIHGEGHDAPASKGRLAFAAEPWKPRLATPRPRIRGVHAAKVVGYPADEISPDEYGRVRVQFPWDRDGHGDELSSCWMPVVQLWGGVGYGALELPRVGQEVLVDFLDGDPDRPVVVGRVFNATQPVPYKLPDHKTISTWKSDSSPGSNGFNEIMFEDRAGDELVGIQAERNLRKLVKHDETITVGHDREKRVLMQEWDVTGIDRAEVTGVNRTQVTLGNRTTVIGGDRAWLVEGNRTLLTEDVHLRLVEGDLDAVVSGTVRERTDEEVHLVVHGDRRERIEGKQTLMVGDERHEEVTGNALFQAGQDIHLTAQTEVGEGDQTVTLKGAGGFIQIDAGGVTIVGNMVKINAGGSPGSAPPAAPVEPAAAREATVTEPALPADPAKPKMLDGKERKPELESQPPLPAPHPQQAEGNAPPASAQPPALSDADSAKKERYDCRKGQIAAGKASDDAKVKAAADRFDRNNQAAEKAALAAAVYPDKGPPPKPSPAPPGWRDVSDDPEALKKYGLNPGLVRGSRPPFTRVYEPNPEVFGSDQKTTIAFAGTDPGNLADWKNNLQQGTNRDSAYYRDAVAIGNTVDGSQVDFTGHSLGGGLATAASSASGARAWTFNSAGLNPGTVMKYGGTTKPTDVTAYRVDGEILTGIQEQGWKGTAASAVVGSLFGMPLVGALAKIGISALSPKAIGKKYDIPASSWSPVGRHGMPDVIAGIEKQKKEDQTLIAAQTGKSCS